MAAWQSNPAQTLVYMEFHWDRSMESSKDWEEHTADIYYDNGTCSSCSKGA